MTEVQRTGVGGGRKGSCHSVSGTMYINPDILDPGCPASHWPPFPHDLVSGPSLPIALLPLLALVWGFCCTACESMPGYLQEMKGGGCDSCLIEGLKGFFSWWKQRESTSWSLAQMLLAWLYFKHWHVEASKIPV